MQCLTSTPYQHDRELVDLARLNDEHAFEELFRRHYRRCLDLATILVRNHWDAEDQVQTAFSKVHERLHQYRGQAEFATWLSRIVINQCFMFMRRRRRARFVNLDDRWQKPDALTSELPSYTPDPEGEMAFSELKEVLRAELRRVPPIMRNIIVLCDIQEMPLPEVADALQISLPAVKSRLYRARAELRSRFERRCDNIGPFSVLSTSAAPYGRVAYRRPMQTVLLPTSA